MKANTIRRIGKTLPLFAALAVASVALGANTKESRCVKQKDGTYKCKASGKIMKEPCCNAPDNGAKATPIPK
jgi:hypothetical protein